MRMRKISPCAPAWGVLACEEDLRAQLFFLLKLIGVSGGIVCLRQGHKVRADGISGGEGGKPDVKEAGEAALPCPLGQGALGSLGATLLACGKGASEPARRFIFRHSGGRRVLSACKRACPGARGTAGERTRLPGFRAIFPSGGATAGSARTRSRNQSLENPICCREAIRCCNESRLVG